MFALTRLRSEKCLTSSIISIENDTKYTAGKHCCLNISNEHRFRNL